MKINKNLLFGALVVLIFTSFLSSSPAWAAEAEWGSTVEEGKKLHKEDFCKRNPNHKVCKEETKPDPKKSCADRFPNFGRGYKNCMVN